MLQYIFKKLEYFGVWLLSLLSNNGMLLLNHLMSAKMAIKEYKTIKQPFTQNIGSKVAPSPFLVDTTFIQQV
jgi:hypothetical protein